MWYIASCWTVFNKWIIKATAKNSSYYNIYFNNKFEQNNTLIDASAI